jgi:outer membrane lipoprotein-sorting protein
LRRRKREGNRLLILAAFLVTAAGCSPEYVSRADQIMDPSAAVKMINDYHDSIKTCRRIFSFSARRKLGSVKGEGILLYIKPDLYRIEVWDEMGNLIFHYVTNGKDYELFIPEGGEELFFIDEDGQTTGSHAGFTIEELKGIGLSSFSVEGERKDLFTCDEGVRVVSVFPGDNDIEKEMVFDKDSGMPDRLVVTTNGKKRREASFNGVQKTNGISRPTRIKIVDHEHSTTITMKVNQEDINGVVTEDLFSLGGEINVD